jgi:hypothetical protein
MSMTGIAQLKDKIKTKSSKTGSTKGRISAEICTKNCQARQFIK